MNNKNLKTKRTLPLISLVRLPFRRHCPPLKSRPAPENIDKLKHSVWHNATKFDDYLVDFGCKYKMNKNNP